MSPAVSCVHHAPCAHRDSRRPALMHTPAAVVVLRPPRAPPTCSHNHARGTHVPHTASIKRVMHIRWTRHDRAPWWPGRSVAAAAGGDGGGSCWWRRRRRCWEASSRRDHWPGGIAGGHDARPSAIGLIGGRGGRSSERMTCGMGRSACAHGTAAMLAREPGSVQCCAAGRKLQAAARDRASRRLARRRVAVDVSHLPISKLVQSSPPN